MKKNFEKTDFLKLSFFAQHLHVPEERLCWGIMMETGEEASIALLIKDSQKFIDVLAGKLCSPINVRGHKKAGFPAKLTEITSNNFELKAKIDDEEISVRFERELIDDIYRRRWFQDNDEDKIFI